MMITKNDVQPLQMIKINVQELKRKHTKMKNLKKLDIP